MIIGRIHDGVYYRPGDPGFDTNYDDRPLRGIPTIRDDKPHVSKAGAVHRDQVNTFNEQLRAHGIRGAYYDPKTGNLTSTSKYAREKAARLRHKRFN